MPYRRREYMTERGETLLLASSVGDVITRFDRFLTDSGLNGDTVVASPLSTVPIPSHPTQPLGTGRFWPENTNPDIMWHPFMWLPARVSQRYRFTDKQNQTKIESEDAWVARVIFECLVHGLYDAATGTWLDVLDTVGMSSDDPVDNARIVEWLAGEPDEDLDSIDLGPDMLNEQDPHWALESVDDLLPLLKMASWARLAEDFARLTFDVIDGYDDAQSAADDAAGLADLAARILFDVPAFSDDVETPPEQWARIERRLRTFDGHLESLLAGPIMELSESFHDLRDAYWPSVVALADAATGEVAEEPAAIEQATTARGN